MVPITIAIAVGAIGFGLMLAAFMLVGRRGGWQQAMAADIRGHWPAPRRLMFTGASLGIVFALFVLVPGVVPWWNYSSGFDVWGLGVVFGVVAGSGLTNGYWSYYVARRDRLGRADRPPAA
jgi:hypothetical protein